MSALATMPESCDQCGAADAQEVPFVLPIALCRPCRVMLRLEAPKKLRPSVPVLNAEEKTRSDWRKPHECNGCGSVLEKPVRDMRTDKLPVHCERCCEEPVEGWEHEGPWGGFLEYVCERCAQNAWERAQEAGDW